VVHVAVGLEDLLKRHHIWIQGVGRPGWSTGRRVSQPRWWPKTFIVRTRRRTFCRRRSLTPQRTVTRYHEADMTRPAG
jgi:hypothetical protein